MAANTQELQEASEKVLGFKSQVHKEWITPETWKLIDERKSSEQQNMSNTL
jgi:protoheme ferro-lyase